MKWLMVTVFVLFGQFTSVNAQYEYYHFNAFNKEETHLSSAIKDIYEDEKGYLWFSGFDGISRFDGHQFKRIEELYPEYSSIPLKNTGQTITDQYNNIWIRTNGRGIYRISSNGELASIQSISGANGQYKDARVIQSCLDHLIILDKGQIYIYRIDANGMITSIQLPNVLLESKAVRIKIIGHYLWVSFDSYVIKYGILDKTSKKYDIESAKIYQSIEGKYWALSNNGKNLFYFLDESNDVFVKNEYQPFEEVKRNLELCWVKGNKVWVSNFGFGISLVDLTQQRILIHPEMNNNPISKQTFVSSPFYDSKGYFWVFADHLYSYPPELGFDNIKPIETFGKAITDVWIEKDTILYSVHNNGFYLQDASMQLDYVSLGNEEVVKYCTRTHKSKDQYVVCGFGYVYVFDLNNKMLLKLKTSGIVRSIFEDDKEYWVAGFNELISINKKSFENKIYSIKKFEGWGNIIINEIEKIDNNRFWLATNWAGVVEFDIQNEEFKRIPILTNVPNGDIRINRTIDMDYNKESKTLAIASDHGLYLYGLGDHQLKEVASIKNFVLSVLFKDDHTIWCASENGLFRYNIQEDQLRKFTVEDGLINHSYYSRSKYKDTEGNLYFGGTPGVVKIDQVNDLILDDLAINIHQVIVNQSDTMFSIFNDFEVGPPVEVLEWVIDVAYPNQEVLKMEYQLNDAHWIPLDYKDPLVIFNPSLGRKSLHLRVKNKWSNKILDDLVVDFTIKGYWYQSTWAKGLGIASLFLIGYLSLQYRNKKEKQAIKEKAELKNEISVYKLKALNAQMNPHFVFNALSSIQNMIYDDDHQTANDYLVKFSRLLRHVIQYSSNDWVLLEEELEFVKNYLDLEKMRFNDEIHYHIKIDTSIAIDSYLIPTFFIQPQLENAIKHGIMNSERKGEIDLILNWENELINIEIIDNGIGRERASKISSVHVQGTKKGIELTQKRIEHLNSIGTQASYEIDDVLKDGDVVGTKVKLRFQPQRAN